jgi:hypothetical protein
MVSIKLSAFFFMSSKLCRFVDRHYTPSSVPIQGYIFTFSRVPQGVLLRSMSFFRCSTSQCGERRGRSPPPPQLFRLSSFLRHDSSRLREQRADKGTPMTSTWGFPPPDAHVRSKYHHNRNPKLRHRYLPRRQSIFSTLAHSLDLSI